MIKCEALFMRGQVFRSYKYMDDTSSNTDELHLPHYLTVGCNGFSEIWQLDIQTLQHIHLSALRAK